MLYDLLVDANEVIRRIGGLEMRLKSLAVLLGVIRRIGGLETSAVSQYLSTSHMSKRHM